MSEESQNSGSGCLYAALHWVAWISLMPAILVAITVFMALWMFATAGGDLSELLAANPEELMTPGFLGVTTWIQLALMALGAAFLALFLPRKLETDSWPNLQPEHMADAHALARSHPAWLIAAAVGTITVGLLPGWAAGKMLEIETFAAFEDGMSMIGETLSRTDDPGWILFATAVVVAAPIFEELIFRGYLWKAAEGAMHPAVIWIMTSFLFAAYHGNPVHIVAVFPLGLFFGWLRWMSGSVWPGMLGHFVNNTWALVITLAVGMEPDIGVIPSALGFCFTLGVCGAAWAWVRRQDAPE